MELTLTAGQANIAAAEPKTGTEEIRHGMEEACVARGMQRLE